jgi:hypothetical protein
MDQTLEAYPNSGVLKALEACLYGETSQKVNLNLAEEGKFLNFERYL